MSIEMTPIDRVNLVKILVNFLINRKIAYKNKGLIPTLELLIDDLDHINDGISGDMEDFLDRVDLAYQEVKDRGAVN